MFTNFKLKTAKKTKMDMKIASLKISVVIPAYNEEKYIKSTLDSLKNQTLKPFEIIVVDNNSTDKTKEIAESFKTTVIHERKQGYVYTLNTGMMKASGDIIAVTDADTILDKNWLWAISDGLKEKDTVGITGVVIPVTKHKISSFLGRIFYSLFLRINFMLGKPHLTGFNFAVKREAFREIGGLDLKYEMSPDIKLGLSLKRVGRVMFFKKMIVYGSMRRFEKKPFSAFLQYASSYFRTVWLKKVPKVKQDVIR